MYGFKRTLIKVQGQYHMKKKYNVLPNIKKDGSTKKNTAIIGCGNFSYSNIAYYIKKNYGNVIKAAIDTDINKAASLFERYNLSYYTDDIEKIMEDDDIELFYIASNHASHAEYAIKAISKNKAVHIEKPHVINFDQLKRLCKIIIENNAKVNLGFNRPLSKFGKIIFEHLKKIMIA